MVGGYREGSRKDKSNSAVPRRNIQGVGGVSVTLWKQKLGGDRGDSQGPDGILPAGGAMDHGDDGETWGRQRVGISSRRGGNGLCRDPPHDSTHKEATDNHILEVVVLACLCILHGGGEDFSDKLDGALV